MKSRPEVDCLRAVAMLVVRFHAKLGSPGGYVGVFFVFSGHLLTSLIERDLNAIIFEETLHQIAAPTSETR